MSWITGIFIFISGLAVGAIIMRLLTSSENNAQDELSNEIAQNQQELETKQQELTTYLSQVEASFSDLAEQANNAAQTAKTFSTQLLKSNSEDDEIIPYFGDQVSVGLQQTKPVEQLSKKFEVKSDGNAPKDYSEGNSGILVAETEK
jgi:uncharacterized membrane-anchored protein YhcB (DUF1043 family)